MSVKITFIEIGGAENSIAVSPIEVLVNLRKYLGKKIGKEEELHNGLRSLKDTVIELTDLKEGIEKTEIPELRRYFQIRTRPATLIERLQGKGKEVYLTPVLGSRQSEAYVYACLILNTACNAEASHISMVPLDGLVNISYTINGQLNQMPSYPRMGHLIKDYEGLHVEIVHGLKGFVGLGSIADIQSGTGDVSIRGAPYKMTVGTTPTQYGLKVDIDLEKRIS